VTTLSTNVKYRKETRRPKVFKQAKNLLKTWIKKDNAKQQHIKVCGKEKEN
jgi:hypothetical protein